MTAHDPATLNFYASSAEDYTARLPEGINCDLPRFLDHLPAGASVLELGCGAGRDAAYMLQRGFRVDPTDAAPAMAALAQQRLGQPVRVMRFDQLDAADHYDAIYASYSLLHVPRTGLPEVLQRIWRALRPGGWHMATYKRGGGEGRDELGRYFNYLSAAEAEAFYGAAGAWQEIGITTGEGAGYCGRLSPWINVIARKAP